MTMSPRVRLLALTVHVISSVGWIGAVACYLALTLVALANPEAPNGRAAYIAMDLMTTFVIVPLALVSPLSGIVSSLGTSWGLFRHYWVLVKTVLTIPATIVLLIHTKPINLLAAAAIDSALAGPDVGQLRTQLLVAAIAALAVLLTATVLSVYKPRGRTRFAL